jgi:hypothetical protein
MMLGVRYLVVVVVLSGFAKELCQGRDVHGYAFFHSRPGSRSLIS